VRRTRTVVHRSSPATRALEAFGREHGLEAFMDRWHALAASYRYLRIKGGPLNTNAGRIG